MTDVDLFIFYCSPSQWSGLAVLTHFIVWNCMCIVPFLFSLPDLHYSQSPPDLMGDRGMPESLGWPGALRARCLVGGVQLWKQCRGYFFQTWLLYVCLLPSNVFFPLSCCNLPIVLYHLTHSYSIVRFPVFYIYFSFESLILCYFPKQ